MRDFLATTAAFGDRDFLVYEGERTTYAEHLGTRRRPRRLARRARRRQGRPRRHRDAQLPGVGRQLLGHDGARRDRRPAERVVARTRARVRPHRLRRPGAAPRRRAARAPGAAPRRARTSTTTVVCRHRGDVPAGVVRWEDLRPTLDLTRGLPDVAITPDDHATILYTSGTTGAPEGGAGDAAQPRHEHHEHAADGRRRRGRRRRHAGPRQPAAAGRRAAGVPVLPHRRAVRALRHDGARQQARDDVQVGRRRGDRPARARSASRARRWCRPCCASCSSRRGSTSCRATRWPASRPAGRRCRRT